ncbi:hypothetical protein SFRURICE_006379, partial [Spodoptera frugiperda]
NNTNVELPTKKCKTANESFKILSEEKLELVRQQKRFNEKKRNLMNKCTKKNFYLARIAQNTPINLNGFMNRRGLFLGWRIGGWWCWWRHWRRASWGTVNGGNTVGSLLVPGIFQSNTYNSVDIIHPAQVRHSFLDIVKGLSDLSDREFCL